MQATTNPTPANHPDYTFSEVSAMARQGGCEVIDLGDEYVLRKRAQGTFFDLISADSLQWLGELLAESASAGWISTPHTCRLGGA